MTTVQYYGTSDSTLVAGTSGGTVFYTAAIAPLDAAGEIVHRGNVQAQAQASLQNVTAALADVGAALTDVVKLTVYVAEHLPVDLAVAVEAVTAAYAPGSPPPVTVLGVSVLSYDHQLVAIEAVAAVAN